MESEIVKADALNPRELFGGTVHYEIPVFQRPYVWTEEDQWAPLWADVRRVAEDVVRAADDDEAAERAGGHFLGAVVFKAKSAIAGDVTRHSVIDGQQRTTTLQILLDAVNAAVSARGHEDEAEALEELILNKANRFAGKPERFKLWPARSDRAAFEYAMSDDHGVWAGDDHLIVEAHQFFRGEVHDWLAGVVPEGEIEVGDEKARVRALADVMQTRLFLVAINLTAQDDDQVIFETLNDRGTPLLKADLVKNWVFQVGEQVHADVETWPERFWVDFDDAWWREEISQGRHNRSRIDIFLQYWLTMRTRDEVVTEQVFREFTNYARPRMPDAAAAEKLLGELRRDANTFRGFGQQSTDSVGGRFYRRVVEALELASTTPVLLWMLSENHAIPSDQVSKALAALESWVVRRTLLRRTMKDVNRFMVAILSTLDDVAPEKVGDIVEAYLAIQNSDARSWPTDADVVAVLPQVKLYGNVRQARLRVVLEALEKQLRSGLHEDITLPADLQVEHVMPQGWRAYWDSNPKLSLEAAAERDRLVNTIGNLTLVTSGLNGTLSNRPWTDEETAALVKATGDLKGVGKRSLVSKFSLLALSKDIVENHPRAWTETDIAGRSEQLARALCQVWPGPPSLSPKAP
ncbi:DUF262 domain-containing protein [Blastococcus sp. TF02A-30]|uniref:DUF262 domain-containing protein n=1 Tax=Blastococcus sp. TF02A-30 TaxID=2250580 RepID=UPI000DEB72CD|nr:DUF262 domain-containing protein [Blastococcus sp. TF02A-30]RBY91045.1 hypothetical protein DQ241_05040 [Blastococcus sp. TF02A-30]